MTGFLGLVGFYIVLLAGHVASHLPSDCPVVILSAADDPYYPLALEIAGVESLPLVQKLDQALACRPEILIWVVAPGRLSDAVMSEYGLALKAHEAFPATGIISGTSLQEARALWQRSGRAGGDLSYAVNAANPAAHIYTGRIMAFQGDRLTDREELTKDGLLAALAKAAYLSFTGHGGGGFWGLIQPKDETQASAGRIELRAADLPALDGVVVSTGSCQTLRPWVEDSISLAFVDRGATAYAGFVYSPNEGYLIGEFDGLPFRYTWPDFTVGHVVAVQNRGALQGFAAFPYYHLLGDPRTALHQEPPYQVVADSTEAHRRSLHISGAPEGLVPVRIPSAAAYDFVSVEGLGAARQGEPFYNSRLQMLNIREDKFLLLLNPGWQFTIELRKSPPLFWSLLDLLLDSLDDTLLFKLQVGTAGDVLVFGAGLTACLLCAVVAWRRGHLRRDSGILIARVFAAAFLAGFVMAALYGFYGLLRLERTSITSKDLVFSLWAMAGVYALITCGAYLFLTARGRAGKLIALSIATLPTWLSAFFGLALVAIFKALTVAQGLPSGLWNYNMGIMPSIAFSVVLVACGALFTCLRRWVKRA